MAIADYFRKLDNERILKRSEELINDDVATEVNSYLSATDEIYNLKISRNEKTE